MRLEEKAAAGRYHQQDRLGNPAARQPNSRTGFFSGFEEDNPYD
jgi:hypothetical protein